jgi:hypothetical protein
MNERPCRPLVPAVEGAEWTGQPPFYPRVGKHPHRHRAADRGAQMSHSSKAQAADVAVSRDYPGAIAAELFQVVLNELPDPGFQLCIRSWADEIVLAKLPRVHLPVLGSLLREAS